MQSSVSHDPSEIILIYWFGSQDTFNLMHKINGRVHFQGKNNNIFFVIQGLCLRGVWLDMTPQRRFCLLLIRDSAQVQTPCTTRLGLWWKCWSWQASGPSSSVPAEAQLLKRCWWQYQRCLAYYLTRTPVLAVAEFLQFSPYFILVFKLYLTCLFLDCFL